MKIRKYFFCLPPLFFIAAMVYVSAAANKPSVTLPFADSALRIDGELTDEAWESAAVFSEFKTITPTAGLKPIEKTTAYLLNDSENIYVGIKCFLRDNARIHIDEKAERDNPGQSDWVAFCLDADNLEQSARFFLLTPDGVMGDGVLDADGEPDPAPNFVWRGAAKSAKDGFGAEMVIPLDHFQIEAKSILGFKVARFIHYANQEADFPAIYPERGRHLSQFQKIRLGEAQPAL